MSLEVEYNNSLPKEYRIIESSVRKPKINLPKGVKSIVAQNLQSDNGENKNSSTYTIQCDPTQMISPVIYEQVDVELTVTADVANNATSFFNLQGTYGPRFMPLNRAKDSINVQINGQGFTSNPAAMLDALLAFNKTPEMNNDLRLAMLDTYTQYENPGPGAQYLNQIGSLKNPLLGYEASTYNQDSRFGYCEILSIDNTAKAIGNARTAKINIRYTEPIWCEPLKLTTKSEQPYLANVRTLKITNTFSGNAANRFFQYLNPVPADLSNIEASYKFLTTPQILYTLVSLADDVEIPKSVLYNCFDYGNNQRLKIEGVSESLDIVPASDEDLGTKTGLTTAMTLSYVPRSIYIWVSSDYQTVGLSDSTAPGFQITSLRLSYGGVDGQFAEYGANQLYQEFSARHGFVKSYQETGFKYSPSGATVDIVRTGLYGSVLRIDATQLAGVDWSKLSVGSAYTTNLRVQVNFTNLHTSNAPANNKIAYLNIQVVNDQIVEIGPNVCQVYSELVSKEQLQDIRKNKPYFIYNDDMMGGNIFDTIKKGLSSAMNTIKDNVVKAGKWAVQHPGDVINYGKKAMELAALGRKKKHSKKGGMKKKRSSRRHMLGGALSDSEDSENENENELSDEDFEVQLGKDGKYYIEY